MKPIRLVRLMLIRRKVMVRLQLMKIVLNRVILMEMFPQGILRGRINLAMQQVKISNSKEDENEKDKSFSCDDFGSLLQCKGTIFRNKHRSHNVGFADL